MAKFNIYKTFENDLDINTTNRTISVIPQLKRCDYNQVKAILNRLGGSWNTQNQVFKFNKCPQALVERVLSVGPRRLNQFHFHPTPQCVFDYMAKFTPLEYLGASEGEVRVLEPSCGEGGLIQMLLAFGKAEGRNFLVEGYDIDPLNVMFCQEAGLNVQQADFLTIEPVAKYDLIIMNPPFNRDEFIKHIQHAQKFLNLNGLLISVVPTHWISHWHGKKGREWLLEQAQINSITNLYPGEFFDSGVFKSASVKTTIICLDSVQKAESIFQSDRYQNAAINEFNLYVDNNLRIWNRLHELKIKDLSEKLTNELVTEKVTDLVAQVLADQSESVRHLVRRYQTDYVAVVMEEWFPDFFRQPKNEQPEQMGFGFMFDEPESEVA